MKKEVLAALFLCLASALPVAAAQGPYVGLGGGLAIVHDSDTNFSGDLEYDLGLGFNVSAGYQFDQMRIAAEFGYTEADGDNFNGDVSVMSYMVNGYYDMKMAAPVSPFFGVGLGLLNGELDAGGGEADDTVFGYQLTAGVTAPINNFLNLEVYYRYQGAGSDFEEDGGEISYDSSLIFAGLRYSFF